MTRNLWQEWPRLRERINSNRRKLCLVDFDGTLAPIAKTPNDAVISQDIKKKLQILSRKPGWQVAAVSGRSLKDLKARLAVDNIWYVGNHGLEIEGKGLGVPAPVKEARKRKNMISIMANRLRADLQCLPGVQLEDKDFFISVHFRNLMKECAPAFRVVVEFWKSRTKNLPLIWRKGKKVWEIGPRVSWHKGTAARYLLDMYPHALPIVLGDDVADEDMFKELKNDGVTVRVGRSQNTNADYHLNSQKEVGDFLEALCKEPD